MRRSTLRNLVYLIYSKPRPFRSLCGRITGGWSARPSTLRNGALLAGEYILMTPPRSHSRVNRIVYRCYYRNFPAISLFLQSDDLAPHRLLYALPHALTGYCRSTSPSPHGDTRRYVKFPGRLHTRLLKRTLARVLIHLLGGETLGY